MAAEGAEIPNENLDTAQEEGGDDEVPSWLLFYTQCLSWSRPKQPLP